MFPEFVAVWQRVAFANGSANCVQRMVISVPTSRLPLLAPDVNTLFTNPRQVWHFSKFTATKLLIASVITAKTMSFIQHPKRILSGRQTYKIDPDDEIIVKSHWAAGRLRDLVRFCDFSVILCCFNHQKWTHELSLNDIKPKSNSILIYANFYLNNWLLYVAYDVYDCQWYDGMIKLHIECERILNKKLNRM